MKLPQIALKNYLFVFVLIILAVFLGMRSFFTMPRAEDPFLKFPFYTLIVVYPGTTPGDMEDIVVDPLEEAVDNVDEITEVRTEITNGLAVIQIEAEFGIDYDDKYDELLAEISNVRGDLPEGIYDFEFSQYSPEDRVVVQQYALVSEGASFPEMHDHADVFRDMLEELSDVKEVKIQAHPQEEIRVSIDYEKMAQMGISLQQVTGVLQGNNRNIPGGDIQSGALSFNIKSTGSYKDLKSIKNTAIHARDNQIVYLTDFATVEQTHEDLKWIARHNGEKCIFVTVTQKSGTNILQLDEALKTTAESFKSELPPGIKLATAFEQAPAVEAKINDFLANLIQGILIVGIIIFLFLGWRSASIVITVIPLSIIIAIMVLDFTGYALQQISIAALVIALGLLVDNAIVVIENIARFRREGYSITDAAVKGTSEVGYAIVSATLTTIMAFLPLALMESGPGEFLRSLPLTVMFVLTASLLLALTFTPIVSSKLLNRKAAESSTRAIRATQWVIDRLYAPALRFSLKKGWLIMVISIGMLMGAMSLFPSIGVSFFPTADKPLLLINVETPYTTDVRKTDEAVRYVEQVLDTVDYVSHYTANTGHGNPQIYYNRIPEEYKKYHGQVMVNFKEWDPSRFYETMKLLRKAFATYPGAHISFSELKNGAPFEAPIEILVTGSHLDTIKRISHDIEQIIRETPGTQDVENPMAIAKTGLDIDINRDKAAMYQLSLMDVDQSIRASLNGLAIDQVILDQDDEEYPLVVRTQYNEKPSVRDLDRVFVTSRSGHQVPLNQIAQVKLEPGYARINHYNMDRTNGVTANVDNPDNTAAITERIIPKLETYDWPEGYDYHVGGEYETQHESFGDLGVLLLVAMMSIFAVLVVQFRSVLQPLIIFSAIPMALTGSFLALYFSGWSFSFFAFVGFISLVGIVVNNSIILVDYTNYLIVEKGMSKVDAINSATQKRFTPIVLTSLTTIFGLMPLTFSGTSLWSPLGWTLMGGMLSSTFLTLFVVPVLYKWLTRENAKLASA